VAQRAGRVSTAITYAKFFANENVGSIPVGDSLSDPMLQRMSAMSRLRLVTSSLRKIA
jgi:hypothetical protein